MNTDPRFSPFYQTALRFAYRIDSAEPPTGDLWSLLPDMTLIDNYRSVPAIEARILSLLENTRSPEIVDIYRHDDVFPVASIDNVGGSGITFDKSRITHEPGISSPYSQGAGSE